MVKSEWGSKRICRDCGTKFYDFARQPIVCPQCGVEVVLPSALKPRRSRAAAAKPAIVAKAAAVEDVKATVVDAAKDEDDLDLAVVDDELAVIADDADDDDDALIEDTSDLGGDEDIGDVVVTNTDDEN